MSDLHDYIADFFFRDTKSSILVPNRATRLENARIDLKIGILTKLTGLHRLVTSPIPLKHSVMVIDIVKKNRKTSKSSKSIRKKSFLYHNFELNRLVTFSIPLKVSVQLIEMFYFFPPKNPKIKISRIRSEKYFLYQNFALSRLVT